MPLGDGTTWDETEPTQSTEASTIDSYERDIRIGVRARMQNEHYWPSIQTATNQAGQHTYITLQSYTGFPGFINNYSGTSLQVGGFWVDSSNNPWYVSVQSSGAISLPLTVGYIGQVVTSTNTSPSYIGLGIAQSADGQHLVISAAFGGLSTLNLNQTYQATSDGILMFSPTNGTGQIYIYSDTSSTPSTLLTTYSANYNAGGVCPVQKSKFFSVVSTSARGISTGTLYFMPVGV